MEAADCDNNTKPHVLYVRYSRTRYASTKRPLKSWLAASFIDSAQMKLELNINEKQKKPENAKKTRICLKKFIKTIWWIASGKR